MPETLNYISFDAASGISASRPLRDETRRHGDPSVAGQPT
jgi:hypothetical protein